MLTPIAITSRDITRRPRQVFDQVKTTNRPAVVFSQRKPLVAIVSLDQLEKLQRAKHQQSAKALLDLAKAAQKFNARGPKDLAKNHDKYTWS